jgi:xanthine dehydrogenase molybdopterin-binding subunit B
MAISGNMSRNLRNEVSPVKSPNIYLNSHFRQENAIQANIKSLGEGLGGRFFQEGPPQISALTQSEATTLSEYSLIGKSIPRVDSFSKVTGEAIFTADLSLPKMLVGKILRSPYPHARILNIDTSKARQLRGVHAVVTGKDTAGEKWGVFRYTRDQQLLCVDKVRYVGDEVAAVAAVDEDTALEALSLIQVDYEGASVFDHDSALVADAPQLLMISSQHQRSGKDRRGDDAAFMSASGS